MPARYRIDRQRRLVISSAWGALSVTDIELHRKKLLSDPDFDPVFSQLLDFTKVTGALMTGEDVRSLAVANIFSFTSRRALLVRPDDSDLFGLARKFKIISRRARRRRHSRIPRSRSRAPLGSPRRVIDVAV